MLNSHKIYDDRHKYFNLPLFNFNLLTLPGMQDLCNTNIYYLHNEIYMYYKRVIYNNKIT